MMWDKQPILNTKDNKSYFKLTLQVSESVKRASLRTFSLV